MLVRGLARSIPFVINFFLGLDVLRSRLITAATATALVAHAVSAQRTPRQFTHADTLRGSNGPGRAWWDASFYDLLGSEARLASYIEIAQGKLPQDHWFALGRLLTTSGREPAL